MKKIKALLAVIAITVAAALILPAGAVQAASVSASFTKTSPDGDVRVEDMVKLELSLSADEEIGAVEAYIAYNSDVFEYISGPDCVLGGEGLLRVTDSGTSSYSTKRNYLLYFRASAVGDCKFSIRNNPEVYDANEGNAMSVSSQPLTLSVLAGTTASSDATLAQLKVGSAVLTPSFDPLIKDYNVRVENSLIKLAVSAVPNDPLASVTVEGADNLKEGSNRITVQVTAPDGTENKYVIYCVREEAPADEEKPAEEDTQEKQEDTDKNTKEASSDRHEQAFYITERDNRIMLIADTEYEMMESDAGIKIPNGFYKTSILISGYTVVAYSPVPDGTPEYLLVILKKDGSAPGLYVYDRMEKTIQRYGLMTSGEQAQDDESADEEAEKEVRDQEAYEKTINTLSTVIAVLSGVCMLLLIITIRLVFRRKGTAGRRGSSSETHESPRRGRSSRTSRNSSAEKRRRS